jgi:replicative DNA helicase
MADKVELTDKFNSGHERLRALYYRLRELAKKHNCAVIAMSQASAEAEGRTVLSMSMLEGSRVGKQSESDLLVGLGKRVDPENPDDPTRWITIMKNKISGRHTTIQCNLEVGLNRYVV